MKKVLIISYFFPPASSTGGTRPLKFVKYLRNFGWEPVVLTVKKVFDYGVPEDQKLLNEIPDGVKIYRTWSFEPLHWYWQWRTRAAEQVKDGREAPDHVSKKHFQNRRSAKQAVVDFFHVPDQYCGWIFFGLMRGLRVIHKEKPSVIFATTPCPSALVIGYFLSRLSGIPLVVDYRDPWTGSCAGFDKSHFMRAVHQFLERKILNHAGRIICVSQTRLEELLNKYALDLKKGAVITNGYDLDDIKDAVEVIGHKGVKLTFIHPGQLYGQSGVQEFLTALDSLIKDGEILKDSICVKFVGSSPEGEIFQELKSLNVCQYLPRVPKKDVLKLMSEADVFLLFLKDSLSSKGWIASKVFDYMLFQKPVIGIVPLGETQRIIDECQIGFSVGHDVSRIKEAIKTVYHEYEVGHLRCQFKKGCERYNRKELTRCLANVLDHILSFYRE